MQHQEPVVNFSNKEIGKLVKAAFDQIPDAAIYELYPQMKYEMAARGARFLRKRISELSLTKVANQAEQLATED